MVIDQVVESPDSTRFIVSDQAMAHFNAHVVGFFNPQIGKIPKECREKSRALILEAVLSTMNAARTLYDPLQRNPICPPDKIDRNARYDVDAPGLGQIAYNQTAYIRYASQVQSIGDRLRALPPAASKGSLDVARAAVLLALENAKESYAPVMDPQKIRILFWRTNDYLTDFTGLSDFPGYFSKVRGKSVSRAPFSSLVHSLNCRA